MKTKTEVSQNVSLPGSGCPNTSWLLKGAAQVQNFYSIILLCAVWEVAARSMGESVFLPALSTVLVKTVGLLAAGDLMPHIQASLYRALAGFLLASLVGVVIGIAIGRYRGWERFWNPLISLTYPIPKVGLVPLFILWLGLGEASKLAVVFTGAVYPVIVNTYHGIKGIPEVLLWRGQTLGANQSETLLRIVLPYTLPHIWMGYRWPWPVGILVFVAEMVAARVGLGFMILQAEQMFQSDVVFAGTGHHFTSRVCLRSA